MRDMERTRNVTDGRTDGRDGQMQIYMPPPPTFGCWGIKKKRSTDTYISFQQHPFLYHSVGRMAMVSFSS